MNIYSKSFILEGSKVDFFYSSCFSDIFIHESRRSCQYEFIDTWHAKFWYHMKELWSTKVYSIFENFTNLVYFTVEILIFEVAPNLLLKSQLKSKCHHEFVVIFGWFLKFSREGNKWWCGAAPWSKSKFGEQGLQLNTWWHDDDVIMKC